VILHYIYWFTSITINQYSMKKLLLLSIFCLGYLVANCLEISIESGSFRSDGQSYLETYIRIIGNTVEFKNTNGVDIDKQAGVELTIIISQGDNIISYERYVLNSPMSVKPSDFLDVKRFALPEGNYTFKVEATDINNEHNKLELEKDVTVYSYSEPINLSDVQLFASVTAADPSSPLSKNGLQMEPLTYGFVGPDIDVLNIYTEIYKNELSEAPYFVRYAIFDGHSNGIGEMEIQKFKKLTGKKNEPLVLQLPINKIPSGKYHVLVELFDKSKVTLSTKKADFIRSNPDYDMEYWQSFNESEDYSFVADLSASELDYALRAISAIVYEPKKSLMDYMIKKAPVRAQKKFLLEFWMEHAPTSPELSYQNYMAVAKAIDLEYNNNVGYGFETDRGYMFLRYGKPNNVLSVDTEPDSYPYEIWYFNYLKETNQTNVRFIFYNKTLVHNDYDILHSTCIGERQNPAWEVELYRKGLEVPNSNVIDTQTVEDNWQRNARRYFNDY